MTAALNDGAAGADGADEQAHVAALLALPAMGPHRLSVVLAVAGSPRAAWAVITGGGSRGSTAARRALAAAPLRADAAKLLDRWAEAARTIDPAALQRRHRAAGVEVVAYHSSGYPGRLAEDPEPPALLFVKGCLGPLLDAPTVALVGTRRATAYGLRLARQWGGELTAAGITVVSGLASGIDAAAHEGALRGLGEGADRGGAPLAVVGTGLDVVYPRRSAALWAQVGRLGAVVSEAPLGAQPEPWRFPARNRIIAALADVVVVVESHDRGGSLLTAEEAVARNRPVLAVPGSVNSPASVGTHRLVMDGAGLATSVADVLDALPGRAQGGRRPAGAEQHGGPTPLREQSDRLGNDPDAAALLDALGWEPTLLDDLVERIGWSLGVTTAVLERLISRNLVNQTGPWLLQGGD